MAEVRDVRRRPSVPREIGAIGIAALLGAVSLFTSVNVGATLLPKPTHLLQLVVGLLACAAIPARHRWPVTLTVVLLAISVVFPTAGGASGVALFTVAVQRRAAVAIAVNVLAAVEAMVQCALYPPLPRNWATYWVTIGVGVLASAAVTAWGMVVRARRQLIATLVDRAERAESEQRLLIEQARRRERERMAREMHDVLAHRLSLLSVHAGALEYRPDAPPEEIKRAAGVVRASARQALHDLRDVIGLLRNGDETEPDRPQPTLSDLSALVAESTAAGIVVQDHVHLDTAAVPETLGRTVYRIVQEGLTNALKYSTDATATLNLSLGAGTLDIHLTNPTSQRRAARTGRGLRGIDERATTLGGTTTAGADDGRCRGFRRCAG